MIIKQPLFKEGDKIKKINDKGYRDHFLINGVKKYTIGKDDIVTICAVEPYEDKFSYGFKEDVGNNRNEAHWLYVEENFVLVKTTLKSLMRGLI